MAVLTRKRVDRNRLGKVERTPQGGVFVYGDVMRVGILEYWNDDGSVVREYNPPEVVAAATPMLAGIPLTNEHPPEHVGPANFRKYASGYASGEPKFDGEKAGVRFALQESGLITDVEGGIREEISLGYSAFVDYTPGVTPNGEKYDGIRTEITPNHAAVTITGRAGPTVRLRLDANGDSIIADTSSGQPDRNTSMTPEQIAKLQSDLTAATVRADTATSELTTAQKELKDAKDKLAALDKVRIDALKAQAKALRPKLAAKIDAEGEAYAAAVIEATEAEAPAASVTLGVPAVETPKTDAIPNADAAQKPLSSREKMLKRGRGEKV